MTAVPLTDQQLRDRIAAAFERIDAHQWGYDHGFCSVYGIDQETDSFIDAAIAEQAAEVDRLRETHRRDLLAATESANILRQQIDAQAAELDRLRAELEQAQADVERIRTRENGVRADRRKALRELEQARQQTEAAHCRLHFIAERVSRLDISDDPTGVAGDVGPYLDGPLHPLDLAAYRAAQPSA